MNLSLERWKDVSILVASGPISREHYAVLRAGIRKLFREGKNRIVLELPGSSQFSSELLRELSSLNLMASELSGQIILSQIEPIVRAKIDSFSQPPTVRCFRTREEALAYFHPAEPPETGSDDRKMGAPAGASVPPSVPISSDLPSPDAAASEDLMQTKQELARFASENKHLRHQLATMVLRRRDAPDLKAAQEQITLLQREIADLVEKSGTKDAAKKP